MLEIDFHKEDDDIVKSSRSQMFFKIGVLKNFAIFTGKHLWRNLFIIKLQAWRPEGLQLYQKEAPTQVFSCEYCEILKNPFFCRTPLLLCYYLIASLAPQELFNLISLFLLEEIAVFMLKLIKVACRVRVAYLKE